MTLASESAPSGPPRAVGAAWVLRILFPAALSWTLIVLLAEDLFACMPQGSSGLLEAAVVLGVTGLCILVAVGLYRRWPGFLRVHPSRSPVSILGRLILWTPLLFAVLAALAGGAWYLFMLPREDPGNPQYGVSAVFAAILYPCALTPVFTVFLTWITARGPRGDRTNAGAHTR